MAARNAYWVRVAKIWSGTPSTIPSAMAKPPDAAVSAHLAVSSAARSADQQADQDQVRPLRPRVARRDHQAQDQALRPQAARAPA